jgi:hypothetical protein
MPPTGGDHCQDGQQLLCDLKIAFIASLVERD